MAVTTTALLRKHRKSQSAAAQMKEDMNNTPAPAQGLLSLAAAQVVVASAAGAAQAPKPAPAPAPKTSSKPAKAPEGVDQMLYGILSKCRSHNSYSEGVFHKWLAETLKSIASKYEGADFHEHTLGNLSLTLPRPSKLRSKVLFSCHIDTVDPEDTAQAPLANKSLVYDANLEHLFVDKDSVGYSLGADDGVGVWIMLKMLYAGVPGTYVFHRGEEKGCLGSKAMAAKEAEWLKQHSIAIAFDRPNDYEIITHQKGGVRGASDACGNALKEALAKSGLDYELSTKGVYTDTAQYFELIPECFNLGVGYSGQHGKGEELNVAHANKLLKALIAVKWEELPVKRDPKSFERLGGGAGYQGYQGSMAKPGSTGASYGYDYAGSGGRSGGGASDFRMPTRSAFYDRPVEPELEDDYGYADGNALLEAGEAAVEKVCGMTLDELRDFVLDEPSEAFEAILGLMLEVESLKGRTQKLATLINKTLK